MSQEHNISPTEDFSAKRMIELEEELLSLQQEQGTATRTSWWQRIGDRYAEYSVNSKVPVDRSKYIRLAVTCGWLCGSHRFYSRKPILGTLYLIFFWTGIPFAMTLIDLMIALPMKPDENGKIII